MKILVIGGTEFLGRHFVEAALAAEHETTLFNRGNTNPGLFPEAEHLRGDRDGGLGALEGRSWDAAIDTCGYVPRVVRASAELLGGAVDHYTFVSTLSVYPDESIPGQDEDAPLATTADPAVEEITNVTYGPLKVLCERAVLETFPDRAFVPRPGLIVGPHDPTDRFTYWPWRIARGGEILAPRPPDLPVQWVDARDLAAWMLAMVEEGRTGVFNAVCPPLQMRELIHACVRESGAGGAITWVDPDFLLDRGVAPWSDLPVWLPGEEYAGSHSFDASRAITAGLSFRSLEETVRDTLAWLATLPPGRRLEAGIAPEREAELLAAWRDSRSS